jgi:hypothetical protein
VSETLNLMRQLPCLSIRQPWATSILHGKDIENRSWRTSFRGRFLIHAGKALTAADLEAWRLFVDGTIPDDQLAWAKKISVRTLPRGGIIGVATLIDCVIESKSPWFCGEYGFVLAEVQPLPFMPCKGSLGFFNAKTSL